MSQMGRLIIAMGMGTAEDNHAEAAQNAINDALQHSSWTIIEAMGIEATDIRIKISLGVQAPDALDAAKLEVPWAADIEVVEGGLDLAPQGIGARQTVASAAIEVFLPKQNGWALRT